MQQTTFEHSLRCLSHPISLGAIALLILNDHYLKWHYGTWVTGKLSDVAWLIFAPLMMAALLAYLIPAQVGNHKKVVASLAWIGMALLFTSAKTIPLANDLTRAVQASLLGVHDVDMRRDPSDLIALPSLAISLWLWTHLQTAPRPFPRKAHHLMVLWLATLATTATSGPLPDYGIQCLYQADRMIYTYNIRGDSIITYSSTDGGLTWTKLPPLEMLNTEEFSLCDQTIHRGTAAFEVVDNATPEIRYRFRQGVAIERSIDGGQSWVEEIEFLQISAQVREVFYEKQDRSNPVFYRIGPSDVVIDPSTGNVIVAMSHDGVLVRTSSDGAWQWVSVGNYHYTDFSQPRIALRVIVRELWSTAIVFILIFSGFAIFSQTKNWLFVFLSYTGLALLCVLFLLITAIILNPAIFSGGYYNWDSLGNLTLLISGSIAVPMLAFSLFIFKEKRPFTLLALSFASLAAVVFLIPYILWTQNIIPIYLNAFCPSFGLAASIAWVGYLYTWYRFVKQRQPATDAEA